MLWFWGACGAFVFGALPLGATVFGAETRIKRNAALYAFAVGLLTGGIFGQVFGAAAGQALSTGLTINNVRVAFRINDAGGALTLGLGINVWWPTLVKRINRGLEGKAGDESARKRR